MKRFMIFTAAALISSGAFAQTATVEFAPEQRTKIKQYVTTQKVAPVTVKEKLAVGATLPADVRLSPVPADWARACRSISTSTPTTTCISWSRAPVRSLQSSTNAA